MFRKNGSSEITRTDSFALSDSWRVMSHEYWMRRDQFALARLKTRKPTGLDVSRLILRC